MRPNRCTPVVERISTSSATVSTYPAASIADGTSARARRTASARSAGVAFAVASSKPSFAAGSLGSAIPGKSGSLGVTRAIAIASWAARRTALPVEGMGRGDADAVAVDHGEHPELDVFSPGVLMDARGGEACEAAGGMERENGDTVGADVQRSPRRIGQAVTADLTGAQPRTPTFTFRNRAGAVPCATRAVWPGWPLPQFGVPQTAHSSRLPTASHDDQKSTVFPA